MKYSYRLSLILTLTLFVMACSPSTDPTTQELEVDTGATTIEQDFAAGIYAFESRIGDIRFENGYPTEATAQKLYDEMDFQRAVQVYLWSVPLVAMQAVHERLRETGETPFSPGIFEDLLPPSTLVFTGNNTTLYAIHTYVIDKDDPVVLEVPSGAILGMINNAWQQALADLGPPGPDKGQGGKYLILPPGYDGETPDDGYFVIQSDSYQIYWLLRSFDPAPAGVDVLKSVRMYRWSQRDNPPPMQPYNASPLGLDLTYPEESGYFEMLARALINEYPRPEDKNMLGIMAELGIETGKPFAPDERMQAIFAEAAKLGNAMAATISFNSRFPEAKVWPDREYSFIFIGGTPSFDNGVRHMIDSRVNLTYQAFSTAESMALELVGQGSTYIASAKDASGDWLDGSQTYRLRVSAYVPARTFWALNVYDTGTRSMIDTEQGVPGLDDGADLQRNADGTIDIYMGPTAPEGMESNWIQTLPNRGFFIYFRLYGPEKEWFDRSWKLDDIERID
ncbi:MAG: DUF1254 domain-containing protein [Xanthomonadales bacterium]|nr:DUF1254 domain-containing protein [Xanthomonadales bacterium]